MNILASLIPSEPDKAVLFTNKFSKLYRSVLQLREQVLISLEEELDFVEAYLDLQRIRFREKFSVQLDILPIAKQSCLPPFALQTLLENAIKHNIISEDMPLHIEIKADEQSLVMSNQLQKRKNVKDSTGTGLTNLHNRYALITDRLIEIDDTNDSYQVKLPLIPASNWAECTNSWAFYKNGSGLEPASLLCQYLDNILNDKQRWKRQITKLK